MLKWIESKWEQSKCPHQWHEIDEQFKASSWTESYYITFLYCPFCDKSMKTRRDKANQVLKKQDVKERYGSKY